jgi:hypothetical protein
VRLNEAQRSISVFCLHEYFYVKDPGQPGLALPLDFAGNSLGVERGSNDLRL